MGGFILLCSYRHDVLLTTNQIVGTIGVGPVWGLNNKRWKCACSTEIARVLVGVTTAALCARNSDWLLVALWSQKLPFESGNECAFSTYQHLFSVGDVHVHL